MKTGAKLTLVQALGVGGSSAEVIPFINDASTYWYDFANADCINDTIGDDTTALVYERIRRYLNATQPIKARQPLQIAGGVNFNQATDRRLVFEQPFTITNGKTGLYVSVVATQAVAAQGDFLDISRASTSAASRCNYYIGSSRLPSVKTGTGESATLAFNGTAPAVTLNTKHLHEMELDFVNDTFRMWTDSVLQIVSNVADAGPWANYPATNPLDAGIGNAFLGGSSLSGLMSDLKIYDGVPSSAARISMSAHGLAKAAL